MITWSIVLLGATLPSCLMQHASTMTAIPLMLLGTALSSALFYTRKLVATMGKKTKQEESGVGAKKEGRGICGGKSSQLWSGKEQSGVVTKVEGVLR